MTYNVGDKAAVNLGLYGTSNWAIVRVVRVTPSGQVFVTWIKGAEKGFNNKGRELEKSGMHFLSLVDVTPAIIAEIERTKALKSISEVVWKDVDTDKLKRIRAILGE